MRAGAIKAVQWDGKRITVPGLYANIPLQDYHRGDICDGPSISSTGLRTLWMKSPAYYWAYSPLNPNCIEDDEEKAELTFGRAVHHLVCGEPGFAALFVIRPDKAPDGKAWHGNNLSCKKWLADQRAGGKSVLKPDDVVDIRGIAGTIAKHPLYRQGLLSGLIEHSMFWKDRETGIWLKARPDAIPTASGEFADLKTTRLHPQYGPLQGELESKGYVQQGALVAEGARALDLEFSSFTLLWCEKTRPYVVRDTTLIDEDLARGAQMNRFALRLFKDCFDAKHWPAPGEDSVGGYLQLSDRARERIDERLKLQLKEAA